MVDNDQYVPGRSARASIALGYALCKMESRSINDDTFVSPTGFSEYYADYPNSNSLKQVWDSVVGNDVIRHYVNDWSARESGTD